MSDSIFSDDFKAQPFWWDATPRPELDQAELPDKTEVLIIGSGICLASYFGNRLGMQVLGRPEGRIAFNHIKFQSRPLYTGKPWFLGAVVNYHQIRDRLL